jgi:hypothetical protein
VVAGAIQGQVTISAKTLEKTLFLSLQRFNASTISVPCLGSSFGLLEFGAWNLFGIWCL